MSLPRSSLFLISQADVIPGSYSLPARDCREVGPGNGSPEKLVEGEPVLAEFPVKI